MRMGLPEQDQDACYWLENAKHGCYGKNTQAIKMPSDANDENNRTHAAPGNRIFTPCRYLIESFALCGPLAGARLGSSNGSEGKASGGASVSVEQIQGAQTGKTVWAILILAAVA